MNTGQTETATLVIPPGNGVISNLGGGWITNGVYTVSDGGAGFGGGRRPRFHADRASGRAGADGDDHFHHLGHEYRRRHIFQHEQRRRDGGQRSADHHRNGGESADDRRGQPNPFLHVAIAEVDFGQTETVTVTPSATANGALSNLGGGSVANGVYTVTGDATQVTAALDGLVWTPTAHEVAPGQSVTTKFTIQATDTAGATASDVATSVVATAVNSPLTGHAPSVGQTTTTDEASVAPFAGFNIVDVNAGQTETATLVIPPAMA